MNERGKRVDTTFLSLENAEERGFIHRDYIAHCLRWTHVIKRLAQSKNYTRAVLLDVGCGREMPLAKTLYSSRYIVEQYLGVDYGPIKDETIAVFDGGKFPVRAWEKTDVCDLTVEDIGGVHPNWLVCFEVLEHVEPAHMLKMLAKFKELTTDDCTYFISTPCWNRVDCAANHVNEMTYEALGAVFCDAGFDIMNVHGTFASIRDYEDRLGRESNGCADGFPLSLRDVFNKLRSYYDSNFLSCVFAPLFPAQSRNCLWELKKRASAPGRSSAFKPLSECTKPWGSSKLWEEMQG